MAVIEQVKANYEGDKYIIVCNNPQFGNTLYFQFEREAGSQMGMERFRAGFYNKENVDKMIIRLKGELIKSLGNEWKVEAEFISTEEALALVKQYKEQRE